MGRRKQYMDDGQDSSDDEGGKISFDVTEDDLDAEMAGFSGQQYQRRRKTNRGWDDSEEEAEEEEETRGGLGMRGGLGLSVGPTFKKAAAQTPTTEPSTPNTPTAASSTASPRKDPVKNKARQNRSATSSAHSAADLSTYSSAALKMLEKMGWKRGQGLGAEGTGITAPIEVKQRPKGMGLSFRGFDERTDQAKLDAKTRKPQLSDEDEEMEDEETAADEMDRVKKRYAWKEGATRKARRPKTIYKTAADILAETEGVLPTTPTQQKIIDMTGPSVREISIADIKNTESPTLMETTTRLPELRHNLKLIMDLSQTELMNLAKEKRTNQLRMTSFADELKTIENQLEAQQQQQKKIQRLKELSTQLDKISKNALGTGAYEGGNITALFGEQFEILEREFADDIETMNVDGLVVSVWAPILKYKSVSWNVIEEPTWGLADVKRWKNLLRSNDELLSTSRNIPATTLVCTPFETMMNTIWLSKVRSAINNQWDVHEPEPIIHLLEEWEPVLPRFIFENIVNQLLLPKIQRAVSDWNPRTDPIMVHTWLHPWFPTLKAWRLADLCITIRQKLSVVLRQWHPSDESALHIISPWKDVWTPQQFEQFINKFILPKLTQLLHKEFRVDPKQQELEPLIWCLAWKDVLSETVIGMLLKNEFFTKWHFVLVQWLSLDIHSINYDQICDWYRWWRQVFSAYGFESNVWVMKEFRRGLDTMNKALNGEPL